MLILHLHTNICSTFLFGNLSDNVSLDNLFFFLTTYPSDSLFLLSYTHHAIRPLIKNLSFLCYALALFFVTNIFVLPITNFFVLPKKKIHIKYNFPFLHFAYSVIIVFVEQSRTYIRALLKHVFFCVFINSGIQVLQLMLCRACSVNVLRCLKVCCASFSLSC